MPGEPLPPPHPAHEAGDYVAYALMALFTLIGLVLASAARDDEMYLFGFALAGFGVVFLLSEVKRHYDMQDRARAAAANSARGARHG